MEPSQRAEFVRSLTVEEAAYLERCWEFWARREQLPPPDPWSFWLLLGGRGAGKTAALTGWVNTVAAKTSGCRIGVIGRTAADGRDVLVEGESGIVEMARRYWPEAIPRYEPSKRRLTWPNGSQAAIYSADEPDVLRGPQHHYAAGDEIAVWDPDAMSNLRLGLRLGASPRAVFATTPRPTRIIRDLLTDPACVVSRMSTYANKDNLPAEFFSAVLKRYEGTSLARQEIFGEILDESPGALWTRDTIEKTRVLIAPPDLVRIVIAIDPSVTAEEGSDECGVMAVGRSHDGQLYVLEDVSGRMSPDAWAKRAVALYKAHRADRIIGEANNGGDLIEAVIRTVDRDVPYSKVHASRGKVSRAEPIAALFEQGRAHLVGPMHDLADQMCTYVPGESRSPDRMDAMVWGATELIGSESLVIGPGESLDHTPWMEADYRS